MTTTIKSRAELTVGIMTGYANSHVIEATGDNDGEQIDKFNELSNVAKGSSYCVTSYNFAVTKAECYRQGIDPTPENMRKIFNEIVLKNIIPGTASVTEFMTWAQKKGLWIERDQWRTVLPGYGVAFDFTRPGGKLMRHWECVVKCNPIFDSTVGGNTMPEGASQIESNDPRHNGGVFERRRVRLNIPGFRTLGYFKLL